MTDVTSDIEAREATVDASKAVDDVLLDELMARVRASGMNLTGEDGLLQ